MKPKRGEVWWVIFDPSVGSEIQKLRPAVVVSNNISNVHIDRFQVVPLTTQIDRFYPGEAFVFVNNKKRKAMTNQLTTSSISRFTKKYTELTINDMQSLEQALKIQLGLE